MKKKNSLSASMLIIILAIVVPASAQYGEKQGPFFYAEAGGAIGNINTGKIAFNSIFAHNNILTFGYYYSARKAPGMPPDFKDVMGFNAKQTFHMAGLMYGKVIYSINPGVRYLLRGGISFGQVSTPKDFVLHHTAGNNNSGLANLTMVSPIFLLLALLPDGSSSTYSYTTETKTIPGLVLNPSIELPVSRIFGFSVGAYANINSVSNIYGIDANITFGKVRNSRDSYSWGGRHQY
jgi:hypothetical protein